MYFLGICFRSLPFHGKCFVFIQVRVSILDVPGLVPSPFHQVIFYVPLCRQVDIFGTHCLLGLRWPRMVGSSFWSTGPGLQVPDLRIFMWSWQLAQSLTAIFPICRASFFQRFVDLNKISDLFKINSQVGCESFYGSWNKNFKQRSYIFRLLLKQNNGNVISFQDEVRANTADWSSLGMHGNQSGPLVCDSTVTEDQLIGQYG